MVKKSSEKNHRKDGTETLGNTGISTTVSLNWLNPAKISGCHQTVCRWFCVPVSCQFGAVCFSLGQVKEQARARWRNVKIWNAVKLEKRFEETQQRSLEDYLERCWGKDSLKLIFLQDFPDFLCLPIYILVDHWLLFPPKIDFARHTFQRQFRGRTRIPRSRRLASHTGLVVGGGLPKGDLVLRCSKLGPKTTYMYK